MLFQDFTTEQAAKINMNLRLSLSQGDYLMMPIYISSQTNEELQKWVDQIDVNLMPSDHTPSMNKQLLRMVFADQSLNPLTAFFS